MCYILWRWKKEGGKTWTKERNCYEEFSVKKKKETGGEYSIQDKLHPDEGIKEKESIRRRFVENKMPESLTKDQEQIETTWKIFEERTKRLEAKVDQMTKLY